MPFFFSNSHNLSSHFYPVSTPFPFPFHSTVPNLVSDLFPSPSFFLFYQCAQLCSHFFSRPPFLIPIVGCTIYFTFHVSQPAREPGFFSPIWHCRTDWSTVRPIGSSHYNVQLWWRRKSGKVCMCMCVCGTRVCGFLLGESLWSVG